MGSKNKRTVTVVIIPLTEKEARRIFLYRPHNKYSESRFGGNNLGDDTYLLLNEFGKRCKMCTASTKKEYLKEDTCPDCDGRSEYNGKDPRSNEY